MPEPKAGFAGLGPLLRGATMAVLLGLAVAVPGRLLAQERLAIGPGQSLRIHPAPGPEQPVSARYQLDLAEGDWLVVTVPAAIVQGAGTEPPIRLVGPAGQEAKEFGRLVHRIATAGTWTLELRDFHALSVSRYPAGHPVVEVGLDPGAVRLETGGLGTVAMAEEKMDPRYDDAPPPSGWPARLAIRVGERMTIHLYRRAALRQMELWPNDPTRTLAAMLDTTFPIETSIALPMFPIGEHYVAHVARAERLGGGCFRFLRYLARWTQEEAYPFDEMTYVALGLSQDGSWFAVATAGVVPAPVPGQPPAPQAERPAGYLAALDQAIARDAGAVSPPLAALDRVVTSLGVGCATR